MLAVAIPAGLLIGLALGALGGGGSILTVPALVYLLDQAPHAATTGSLLIVGTAALVGMVAHRRAGRVRIGPGLVFAGLGLAGSYVGSRLSTAVDPHVLLTAFAALMLAAAAALRQRGGARRYAAGAPPRPGSADRLARARAHHRAALADGPATAGPTCPLPSVTPRITTRRAVTIVAAATAVGLLTGFFGVGGGFVIVPALVLVLGFDMPAAVGTSLLVIAVTSAAAPGGPARRPTGPRLVAARAVRRDRDRRVGRRQPAGGEGRRVHAAGRVRRAAARRRRVHRGPVDPVPALTRRHGPSYSAS